jgi:hypothetical protein
VAQEDLARLVKPGIDLGAIYKLLADGLTAFTHSLDELLASLKEKRREFACDSGGSKEWNSGPLALCDFARD